MRATTFSKAFSATLLLAPTLAAPADNQLLHNSLSARTEGVECDLSGIYTDRWRLTAAVDNFCAVYDNKPINMDTPLSLDTDFPDEVIKVKVQLRVRIINTTMWLLAYECSKMFRYIIDECETAGVEHKMGGSFFTPWGQLMVDPVPLYQILREHD